MPKLAHRIEYLLLRGVSAAANALPTSVSSAVGARVGRLGYRPLGIRRRQVEENLRRAFPERGEEWIRATAAASYAHLGREMLAMLRMSRQDAEEIRSRTEVVGLELLEAAMRARKGVVLATGHFGNWEIGGAALTVRGVPLHVIAQRQSNPLVDAMINGARERLGMRVIDRGRAPKLALSALREGNAVAFVADQDARSAGVFVPFFGRLASTHRGAALMAMRTGAAVFLAVPLYIGGGRYRLTLEPVEVERAGDPEEVVERITAAFTARLEAAIRGAPGQYFWQHRRWKTRPPEEQ